ncbi:ribosomal biogenesis protein LAS1L [Podarcis raffonei]|uniref:ribosomal biogenesis protein LAS1L n=1 Tax=Podarcis raffonei TaxID=65483 RepID=UPI00232945F8|nr:ribosomal biogenesis protein LAS1L [Podarcis raffonei]XP_053230115.1 ribosomal biogenesis protein LAS1L [Podarcis raffonei]
MASGPSSTTPGWKQMSWRKRPQSVVAWESKAEWDQVMVGLYCGDREIQQDALDRISAWKSRYGHRMPLAVECTADLIRCKLLDASGVLKSNELVLTYGLALVRFVNLITERKQKTVIIPLRRLAKELNIPVWIVNLRHDLTHGNLPHLDACQKGCDVVLEWLRQTYWSRQLANNLVRGYEEDEDEESPLAGTGFISSITEPEKLESLDCQGNVMFQEKVVELLVSYKNQQFEVLQQEQDINQVCKLWYNSSAEIQWIVAQVKELFLENREAMIEVLLDDGFLIPTTEELNILNIEHLETTDWDFRIPQSFGCFWYPLLRGLHSRDFTQTLAEMLFCELKKFFSITELRSDYLIRWLTKILETSAPSKKKSMHSHTNSESTPEPFLQNVSLQWQKLLDCCLEATCWASLHLMHMILEKLDQPLPPDSKELLLYLTSIYTQEDTVPSPGSIPELRKQPIYTVESLQWQVKQSNMARGLAKRTTKHEWPLGDIEEEEEMEEEEAEAQAAHLYPGYLDERKMVLLGSVWQVSPDWVKWGNYPLGKLPDQSDDPDNLLVENYFVMLTHDQLMDGGRNSTPNATSSEWGGSAAEGLLWTQSDLHKIKNDLQLF